MKTSSRPRPMSSNSVPSSLPAAPDEGNPLLVLLLAGRLSDEQQAGVRVARSEHDLGARLGELRATPAGARLVVQLLERLAARGGRQDLGQGRRCYAARPPGGGSQACLCDQGPPRRLPHCYRG